DLRRGPLLRIILVRMEAGEHVLLLAMHHIVTDGWSMNVLVREVITVYAAYSSGRVPDLPPLSIQYADFAVWQRNWLQGEVLEQQLSYWKTKLEGTPTVQLPTDRPRLPVQSYRGGKRSLVLGNELSDALKALSRQENVTLFMTLL